MDREHIPVYFVMSCIDMISNPPYWFRQEQQKRGELCQTLLHSRGMAFSVDSRDYSVYTTGLGDRPGVPFPAAERGFGDCYFCR